MGAWNFQPDIEKNPENQRLEPNILVVKKIDVSLFLTEAFSGPEGLGFWVGVYESIHIACCAQDVIVASESFRLRFEPKHVIVK